MVNVKWLIKLFVVCCLWFVVYGECDAQIIVDMQRTQFLNPNRPADSPLPANFTAQWDYVNSKIILNATVFPDATSIEQIEVRGELSQYSENETDGEAFLSLVFSDPVDTTQVQNSFALFDQYSDDDIWFVTLWVKNIGESFYTQAKQDTIWIDVQ